MSYREEERRNASGTEGSSVRVQDDEASRSHDLSAPRNGSLGSATPQDILHAVAEESGISLALLLCARRDRKIARPRQLAMYLMRKLCFELSLAKIGANVGGRDHKTVMHACDLMDYLLTRDRDLQGLQQRVFDRLYCEGL
ncbi:helix-turn-helix domain-containing protein [Pelagibius sp. Alg239-R121]|uniref:helix-turn-helix domain-containing protein n=1 Tax=Pelagibius sp. Alg239-R121 TaxID=2993448 RepID=UPI0024A6C1CE|nr:helix-turn-helix domain-containing protein [Pelagibius sp. Alg239-R121]